MTNTNALLAYEGIGGPFPAAEMCRALGPEWFLPARHEAVALYVNREAIGGFDPVSYWNSTNHTDYNAWIRSFDPDYTGGNTSNKSSARPVRCLRR